MQRVILQAEKQNDNVKWNFLPSRFLTMFISAFEAENNISTHAIKHNFLFTIRKKLQIFSQEEIFQLRESKIEIYYLVHVLKLYRGCVNGFFSSEI